MQSSPQAQSESPALTEVPSLLIVAFTEHAGPGTTSLSGGSSLLIVSLGSQKRDEGMYYVWLMVMPLVPRCPVPGTASKVRTWPG
jgi:hypothetical protein